MMHSDSRKFENFVKHIFLYIYVDVVLNVSKQKPSCRLDDRTTVQLVIKCLF